MRGIEMCIKTKKIKPHKVRSKKGEKWKLVDENYLLSNFGRWYSVVRKKILKQNKNNWGYYRAYLQTGVVKKHVFTHIKVVELFGDKNGSTIPENASSLRELGLSIDHVNRSKRNNRFDNLELVTHQENCIRKFA